MPRVKNTSKHEFQNVPLAQADSGLDFRNLFATHAMGFEWGVSDGN
jgi:hypothetical protein